MSTMKILAALAISAAALTSTAAPSNALGRFLPGLGHGPVITKVYGSPGHGISCLACNLPRPNPGHGLGGQGGYWGGHGLGGYFGGHRYWGHRFWERPVIIGGAAVAAPMVAAAASAPAPAEAAHQASPGSGNCLTKQTLADGSVLFADICTQQSAIAPPQAMSSR
jgi:hypothetical protein